MAEAGIDINLVDNPGIFIEELDEDILVDVIFDDHIEIDIASSDNVSDHGVLSGLADDDHPHYYNQARGDARYEKLLGSPAADDYILSSKANGTRSWIIPPTGGGGTGVEYHNALLGIQGGATDDNYHLTQNLYNAFEYVPNGGSPYLRVKLPISCDGDVQAHADTGWLPPSIWASMPYATSSSKGGIQFTSASPAVKYLREDGAWVVPPAGGSSMTYPGAGIARSTGAAWAASLTDNSEDWNEAHSWGSHEGLYSLLNHNHSGVYSPANHNHSGVYAPVIHTHAALNTANFSILEESGKLVIKYGTTVITSFSSVGLEKAANDIIAFATP